MELWYMAKIYSLLHVCAKFFWPIGWHVAHPSITPWSSLSLWDLLTCVFISPASHSLWRWQLAICAETLEQLQHVTQLNSIIRYCLIW